MTLQKILCWFGFHSYDKWKDSWTKTYKNSCNKPYKTTIIQERRCLICGKLIRQEVQ